MHLRWVESLYPLLETVGVFDLPNWGKRIAQLEHLQDVAHSKGTGISDTSWLPVAASGHGPTVVINMGPLMARQTDFGMCLSTGR